jgi:hypothetical protein
MTLCVRRLPVGKSREVCVDRECRCRDTRSQQSFKLDTQVQHLTLFIQQRRNILSQHQQFSRVCR